MVSSNRSVMAFNLSFLFDYDILSFVARFNRVIALYEAGKLKCPPVTVFPFTEEGVRQAHDAIESGLTVGKRVMTVAD